MQELTIQTPTYLFAAVNLLLLAYFNRFHALSTRIRDLAAKDRPVQVVLLRKRLEYAKRMIVTGILGVMLGLVDVFFIAAGKQAAAWLILCLAAAFVLASLFFALKEIAAGTKALDEELRMHDARIEKLGQ